jgi:hypothetical protein
VCTRLHDYWYTELLFIGLQIKYCANGLPTVKGDLPKVKSAIQRRSTSLKTIAEVTAVAEKE